MSRTWNDDDDRMPPRVPRPRDPEGRLIRPALPARRPRMSVAGKLLCLMAVLAVVFLAVAAYNNHQATTGPRVDCELSGGLYSSDLHACLRMPQ